MGTRRRMFSSLLAVGLALSAISIVAAPASASCLTVWTGQQTASKTATYGIFTYTATVKYELEYNTCNLGVYSRIQVDTFIDKYTISGGLAGSGYVSDLAHVLKDCTGHADSGCLVYPGQKAYTDNTNHIRTGDGVLTRTASPGSAYRYPYSLTTATFDFLYMNGGLPSNRFVYQFLRNQIYIG